LLDLLVSRLAQALELCSRVASLQHGLDVSALRKELDHLAQRGVDLLVSAVVLVHGRRRRRQRHRLEQRFVLESGGREGISS